MLGAVIGDIVGSVHEFLPQPTKTKDFGPLFVKAERVAESSFFTDDTVCSMAIAEWVMAKKDQAIYSDIPPEDWLRLYGRLYPGRGYGGMYQKWLNDPTMGPYNSWGNGAPMRCAPCGIAAETLEESWELAGLSAMPTHSHPQAIKGAKVVSGIIFLLREGKSLEEAIDINLDEFDEDEYYRTVLDFSLDDIRPDYTFKVSSKNTVPQAIRCVVEGEDFEDVIRNAISLGGDADTLAAIAGSMAEPLHGITEEIAREALSVVDDRMRFVIMRMERQFGL
jgi:ADP-ribosylglycohydrolase